MSRGAGWAALAAGIIVVATLGSCGKGSAPPPQAAASPLPSLVLQADRWATRADTIMRRGWIGRLDFRQRLYARIQALRTFISEATAAADAPGPAPERLVERGRELVERATPFDEALVLLEQVAGTMDQLTAYQGAIELNMAPLETRGETPYRIRVTDYGKQVTLGFTHLDLALRGTLEKAKDEKLHQNIAVKALSDALATATKLHEDVKKTAADSTAATDRLHMLEKRVAWAESIVAKDPSKVPAEAKDALAAAKKFLAEVLEPETPKVIEALRNAQPDAHEKAEALASKADAVIERLTKAFLMLGRDAGVPDPK